MAQPNRHSKTTAILLGGIALAIVLACFAMTRFISSLGMVDVVQNLSAGAVDGDQFDERLMVQDPKVTTVGQLKFATGMVTNTSAATIESVQLDLKEVDKAGNVLGSLSPTVKHLKSKATWKFKVKLTHRDAVNFNVDGVFGSAATGS